MSDDLRDLDESLSVEALERADQICETFEDAWRDEAVPEIEPLLKQLEGEERESLLGQLLRLDIFYRRRRGSDPLSSDYCDRFPESTQTIDAVFRAAAGDEYEQRSHARRQSADTGSDLGDGEQATMPFTPRRVSCPHCSGDVTLVDVLQSEVQCVNCGNTMEVDAKATSAYPLLPKTIGRFRVIERLGHGSFGVVYKAHDPDLDILVAIKLARPDTLDTPDRLQRFLLDARSAARLKHAHIVRTHDVGNEDGVPYIVNEFIEGMTLEERLSGKPLSFEEASRLTAQIAHALDYAHHEKVIHRDVKPSNIVIDRMGTPYLTDFGLAYREEEEIHVTLPGQVVGTPAYMSPEQAPGDAHLVDPRTDLYSLGVVLYELLTGDLPFRGRRRMLLHQVQFDEPPSPRRLNEQVPRDLETICLKCLEKDPATRYSNARALQEDLDRFEQGVPIQARPISAMTRGWRWCVRNPVVSALTGIIFLLLVLLVVVLAMLLNNSRATLHMRVRFALAAYTIATLVGDPYDPDIGLDVLDKRKMEEELDLTILRSEHFPALVAALDKRWETEMREQAVSLLERVGIAASDAIPELQRRTEDADYDKKEAINDLQNAREVLADAVSALEETKKADEPQIANRAKEALLKIEQALAEAARDE